MTKKQSEYDYTDAGFGPFLTRSIDDNSASTLDHLSDIESSAASRIANYDQVQVSGALGDILAIGNIHIDGVSGKISIYDDDGNEVVRVGELSD